MTDLNTKLTDGQVPKITTQPNTKLIIATGHKPVIRDQQERQGPGTAWWQRVVMKEFSEEKE